MKMNEGAVLSGWMADDEAEVQKILRQNDIAFRWFVAGCIAVCSLIIAAMLLS
jgi:hypothetical protein